ncbi:MAG: aminotransferase class I/II-fold pyridoxal phosphate-dependent enzyme [Bacillota bacterium]|jgi:arginine/lysine/ornithine decarboxylase
MSQETPLYSALIKEAGRKTIRMHMPGHKGKSLPGFTSADIFQIDFTELTATGNLYEGIPPISDAEILMARSASAQECFFLTGGSTQGIMTAISIACPLGGTMITDRGSHRSVWSSMVHMDVHPQYLYAKRLEPWGITGPLSATEIEAALKKNPQAAAVIITSPTFYGVLSDIRQISQITQKYQVPLIVDEAHGVHLPFMQGYQGAVAQGAALAIASAHKTLPVLTAGALLFSDARYDAREIRRKASMFGTSSPSYPVMASMDAARSFMEAEGGIIYNQIAEQVKEMRREINARGNFLALEEKNDLRLDPTRLTINTAVGGLDGYQAAQILEQKFNIVCEMADERSVVMIITCADSFDELNYIAKAIATMEKNYRSTVSNDKPIDFPLPKLRMTPREAAYAARDYMIIKEAAGQIAGEHLSPYPPGIPIVAAGEEITEEHIKYLQGKKYDIEREIAIIPRS